MQTGKAHMSERTTWSSLCGSYQKTALCCVCVREDGCVFDVSVYRYSNACACAVSHACILVCVSVCTCVSSMVRGHVRSRRRVLLRWSVNLNEQIAPVCMYSPVNRVDSVTQRPRGYVLLYLPSKNGCVIGSFNCSLHFDFLFSLNWKLEGLLYL